MLTLIFIFIFDTGTKNKMHTLMIINKFAIPNKTIYCKRAASLLLECVAVSGNSIDNLHPIRHHGCSMRGGLQGLTPPLQNCLYVLKYVLEY